LSAKCHAPIARRPSQAAALDYFVNGSTAANAAAVAPGYFMPKKELSTLHKDVLKTLNSSRIRELEEV